MRPGRKRQICLVTNAYPDEASPYPMYGRFVRELVLSLAQNGFAISVVTPRLFRESKAFEEAQGERVYRFWFWSAERLLATYERVPWLRMVTYFISGTIKILRVARRDSCQLIHGHWVFPAGLMAVAAGRLLRRPVVLTVHGSDARWAFERGGLFKGLFAWAVKRADRVTAVSRRMADEIRMLGVEEEKIAAFPMGVSADFFCRSSPRTGSVDSGEKVIILSNRHLLPLYDVGCLLRAVPRVTRRENRALFLIAGDGEERPALEAKVHRMKLARRVRFLGAIPHERMADLLRSCHIFVSTSPADGTSVSLLEAMACGLFPVVTDIPANREWIEHGKNGFLAPPHDDVALADRLTLAIRDGELRRRARRRNVRLVKERASWEKVSQRFIDIHEELLTPRESSM